MTELAEAEKINTSYVIRVMRLTVLAPDIVETVLDGRQPKGLKLREGGRHDPSPAYCRG